jgi:tRNA (guanine-N7-)-methyltransferase
MAQKKLKRFAEVRTFPNVLEYPLDMKGKWASFFENEHPIALELACGKGEYAIGLGRRFHSRNFIGIDLKGNRIWVGAKLALQENLHNVAFIRSQIDKITNYFNAGEIDEIWITFPDPQLRISKSKKRLTHPRFLRLYQQVLKPGGMIHLKTDSPDLYDFTKSVIRLYGLTLVADKNDVHSEEKVSETLAIKTHYESLDIAKSNRIHYLQFLLPEEILPQKDNELNQLLLEEKTN